MSPASSPTSLALSSFCLAERARERGVNGERLIELQLSWIYNLGNSHSLDKLGHITIFVPEHNRS